MAFKESEKLLHPLLNVVEPVWDSAATEAQKAITASLVTGSFGSLEACIDRHDSDREGELNEKSMQGYVNAVAASLTKSLESEATLPADLSQRVAAKFKETAERHVGLGGGKGV